VLSAGANVAGAVTDVADAVDRGSELVADAQVVS
jgi:hypothetical protein